MSSELNRGRAIQMCDQLQGTHTHEQWIRLLVIAVSFLLARYVDGK